MVEKYFKWLFTEAREKSAESRVRTKIRSSAVFDEALRLCARKPAIPLAPKIPNNAPKWIIQRALESEVRLPEQKSAACVVGGSLFVTSLTAQQSPLKKFFFREICKYIVKFYSQNSFYKILATPSFDYYCFGVCQCVWYCSKRDFFHICIKREWRSIASCLFMIK